MEAYDWLSSWHLTTSMTNLIVDIPRAGRQMMRPFRPTAVLNELFPWNWRLEH